MRFQLIILILVASFGCSENGAKNQDGEIQNPVVNERGKGSENFKALAKKWVVSGFDISSFKNEKVLDSAGEKVLIEALTNLVGKAYYDLKIDGRYISGDDIRKSEGTWAIHRSGNELHLLEDSEEGIKMNPTIFKIVEQDEKAMTLSDPDNLKIQFTAE